MKSSETAREIIIIPSARMFLGKLSMVINKNKYCNYFLEPRNLVSVEISPKIGAKKPPPINNIKIEPITIC